MNRARAGTIGTALAVLVLAQAGEAGASGYSVARFGGEHGHPTTTNATAIYYNPAGIGMSDGYHVFLDVSLAWRTVSYEHDAAPTDDASAPPGANDGEAKLFNVLASPMAGLTAKFGDFAVGAGYYVPFGGRASWKKNDDFKDDPNFAGPYDGQQRWYAIQGEITSAFATLAAAYHIVPARLSIGVSGNLILSKVHTIRGKTSDGTNDMAAEGRSLLDVSGTDFSLGFGVLYEAMKDQLWLGASYQSRPNFSGMKPLKGKFKFYQSGVERINEDAELDTELPDVFRIGGRYRPETDIELRLFGDYQRWSVLEQQCVHKPDQECGPESNIGVTTFFNSPRDWKDTFGVRAGVSKWIDKPLEVFAGAGYASNAVPDETLDPALPDWEGISLAVGARYALMEKIFLAGSYTQFYYFPRDNNGKYTVDDDFAPGIASRNPDAGGKYKQMVGVFNVNLDIGF